MVVAALAIAGGSKDLRADRAEAAAIAPSERVGRTAFKLDLEGVVRAANLAFSKNLMDEAGNHLGQSNTLLIWTTFSVSRITMGSAAPTASASAKCDDNNTAELKSMTTRPAPSGLSGVDPATDVALFLAGCPGYGDAELYIAKDTLRAAIEFQLARPAAQKAGFDPRKIGTLKRLTAKPERDEDSRVIPDQGYAKLTYATAGKGSVKSITLRDASKGTFLRKVKRYR